MDYLEDVLPSAWTIFAPGMRYVVYGIEFTYTKDDPLLVSCTLMVEVVNGPEYMCSKMDQLPVYEGERELRNWVHAQLYAFEKLYRSFA